MYGSIGRRRQTRHRTAFLIGGDDQRRQTRLATNALQFGDARRDCLATQASDIAPGQEKPGNAMTGERTRMVEIRETDNETPVRGDFIGCCRIPE